MGSGIIFRFGNFELDPANDEFRRGGVRLRLQGKPMQLLALLLERAPDLVSREQMRERLWPADTYVDFDRNLNAAVMKLREALNDSAETPRFVETMPRRGYRFIAPVDLVPPPRDPAARRQDASAPGWPLSRATPSAARAFALITVLAALLTTSFLPASPVRTPKTQCPPRLTLAVLPFRDLSNAKNPRLGDGFTETLIDRLAHWNPGRLGVVSRRSIEKYRCSSKSVGEIGGELGVTFVVDGTVRHERDRLRVTAEFVQVSDQTQLWSQSFDVPANNLSGAQNELTQSLLKAVAGCLLPQKQQLAAAFHSGRSRP